MYKKPKLCGPKKLYIYVVKAFVEVLMPAVAIIFVIKGFAFIQL